MPFAETQSAGSSWCCFIYCNFKNSKWLFMAKFTLMILLKLQIETVYPFLSLVTCCQGSGGFPLLFSDWIIFVPVFVIRTTEWLWFSLFIWSKASTYSLICKTNRLDKQRVSSIPSLTDTVQMHGLEPDSYSGVWIGLERWFCRCITRSSVSFALLSLWNIINICPPFKNKKYERDLTYCATNSLLKL